MTIRKVSSFGLCLLSATISLFAQQADRGWKDYAGGPDSSHFFPSTQITKANVSQLKLAWNYPYGTVGTSPVISGNVMYVAGRSGSLVALDATTGNEIWIHEGLQGMTSRGINFWESKDGKDKRILFSINNYLQEIDASTGKSITTFGDNGVVDLKKGLGRDNVTRIQSGTPGKVFENLIILGSATGEGYLSPPGDLRAYDVLTGKLAWQFHTVPHPGEPGYETWPKDAWKYIGGVNTWGELTVDPVKGVAYFPTGSATYDFYGADRIGSNLYADCLIALDARTGKLKWYYQMVHHDLWDYDNTSAPQLTTVMHNGKKVDVVAQAGKTGFLYVFDRDTGKPLWPIEERKVPQSNMPGEKASPTQPFPTAPPPFSRQKFTAADVNPWTLTLEEQAALKDRLAKARDEGLFTPPGMTDTVQMPGNNGGSNWGSTAANPNDGTVYVNGIDVPAILKLTKVNPGGGRGGQQQTFVPSEAAQVASSVGASPANGGRGGRGAAPPAAEPFVYPAGPVVAKGPAPGAPPADGGGRGGGQGGYVPYPDGVAAPEDRYSTGYGLMPSVIKPPYSRITAYDLNKGTIKWQKSIGDEEKSAAAGIHDTGMFYQRSGLLVTATGLLFQAGQDGFVRGLDADTGELAWSSPIIPGGGGAGGAAHGVPAMYSVNGREYLVFEAVSLGAPAGRGPAAAASAASLANDPRPKGIVVYALPDTTK